MEQSNLGSGGQIWRVFLRKWGEVEDQRDEWEKGKIENQ